MPQTTPPLPLDSQSFSDPDVAALLAQLDAMDLLGAPSDPVGFDVGNSISLLGIVEGICGLFDFG